MMFIESRFKHVHISKQIWIKAGVIGSIVIGRWRSCFISLKDWILHWYVILELQGLANFILVGVDVVVIWHYFTDRISSEFILVCCLAVVCWDLSALLIDGNLWSILFIVYLSAECGLLILSGLFLLKWIFVLRNAFCTLRDAIVICAVLW